MGRRGGGGVHRYEFGFAQIGWRDFGACRNTDRRDTRAYETDRSRRRGGPSNKIAKSTKRKTGVREERQEMDDDINNQTVVDVRQLMSFDQQEARIEFTSSVFCSV